MSLWPFSPFHVHNKRHNKKLIAKAEKYSIEVYHVMSHIGVGGQF